MTTDLKEALKSLRAEDDGHVVPDQGAINWLKARPHIERFIDSVGYNMTLTNERIRFESREKVDVRKEQPARPALRLIGWANVNKHGDITHTSNKRMPWAKTPLYGPLNKESNDGN